MITVKINPAWFQSMFTQGNQINPLRVRNGIPSGAVFIGCHADPQTGMAMISFADGSPENKVIQVDYDVLVPKVKS